MSASYRHLPLSEVQAGMVLSSQLVDHQGQVLLPEGTVLTAAMIASIARHGIDMLTIGVDMDTALRQQDEATRAAQLQRVGYLFRRHDPDDDRDWASNVLMKYVSLYRANGEVDA